MNLTRRFENPLEVQEPKRYEPVYGWIFMKTTLNFPGIVRVDGALRGKILPVGSIAVKYLYHIDHII